MTVVVDANVLIDALRGYPAAQRAIRVARADGPLWAPATIRVEVLGAMRPHEHATTHALLDRIEWLPVTVELADAAAAYSRQFRASHSGIDIGDYIVAASADSLNARLLTQNVRHFPMFANLEPAY